MPTVLLPNTPRRPDTHLHYNWVSRYHALNQKIANYEIKMMDLVNASLKEPQKVSQTLSYARAYNSWRKALTALQEHMKEPY